MGKVNKKIALSKQKNFNTIKDEYNICLMISNVYVFACTGVAAHIFFSSVKRLKYIHI